VASAFAECTGPAVARLREPETATIGTVVGPMKLLTLCGW